MLEANEALVLAQTIYGEARGELSRVEGGLSALIAVGNVVMNRCLKERTSLEQVCKRPFQFSCWNSTDPNFLEIEHATVRHTPEFLVCMHVAGELLSMNWPDLTNGATHYYAQYLTVPYWVKDMQLRAKIGRHLFFKERGTSK
jgi:spore germination cell wall hydrolase CwlJ-like protein